MDLVEEIYALTEMFPSSERYGLTEQSRRAAVSILANLAEGYSRSSALDKAYKYTIARAECAEVHSLLLVSIRVKRATEQRVHCALKLCLETGRLLTGLIRKYNSNA